MFVLDSVDVERMEEAKMELIRTVKSPENSQVPILVLANKQDLPGAREPRELERLLGLTGMFLYSLMLSYTKKKLITRNYINSLGSIVQKCINNSPVRCFVFVQYSLDILYKIYNLSSSVVELGNGGAPGGHLWHVQPACAITGDGLHEGLEVLYDMIVKRRKLAKERKKKGR